MFKNKLIKIIALAFTIALSSGVAVRADASLIKNSNSEEILYTNNNRILKSDKEVKSFNHELEIRQVSDALKTNNLEVQVETAKPGDKLSDIKKDEVPTEMENVSKQPEITESESIKETSIDTSFWVKRNLNMRKGAGTNHAILLTIPASKEVRAIAKISNGWYKVVYNSETGYVHGGYLSSEEIKSPSIAQKTEQAIKNMTINFPDKVIPFKNAGKDSGQAIIDNNIWTAATWGGAATFSGADGLNTHIIAHNPGAFNGIWNYSIGTKLIISDHAGMQTKYRITEKFIVDDNGVREDNGKEYYSYITSTRGGEVVTFQTCKNSEWNYILRAEKTE